MKGWGAISSNIAKTILDKEENKDKSVFSREEVSEMLCEAAYDGIKYECDSWCLRRR